MAKGKQTITKEEAGENLTSGEIKSEIKTADEAVKGDAAKVAENLPTTFDVAAFSDAVEQEEVTLSEMVLPRITLLQSLSPQLKKTKPEYIADAEEGMLYNAATTKLYDGADGIIVIPIFWRKTFIEWKLRENNGGGFVADLGDEISDILRTCKKNKKNQIINPAGNQIVETYDYAVKIVDEKNGTTEDAIISMSATQLKTGKQWNTIRQNLKYKDKNGEEKTQASFLHAYKLTTVPKQNEQGDWFVYKISYHRPINEIFGESSATFCRKAVELVNSIKSGEINLSGSQGDNIEQMAEGEDSPM